MAFLIDGYRSIILFSTPRVVLFREKDVQAPYVDGRGPIDTTTMRNRIVTTQFPKWLRKVDEVTVNVQYDPMMYGPVLLAMININQRMFLMFPDGTVLSFWGWLDKFTPQSMKEGEFPLAELKIHLSMDNRSVPVARFVSTTVNSDFEGFIGVRPLGGFPAGTMSAPASTVLTIEKQDGVPINTLPPSDAFPTVTV